MNFDVKRLRRKIIRITAAIVATAGVLLLVLRSVYAISMFNGLSAGMRQTGWTQTNDNSIIQDGEELTFEASYLFIKIGTVKMQVVGKTIYDGVPAYHLRAYIDSYSGIPFVNLHAMFDTYQDAKSYGCLFTSNIQKDGGDSVYTAYHFDFTRKIMDWSLTKNGKQIEEAKIPLDKDYTDGVGFFYFIREAAREAGGIRTTLSIPIVVDTVRSKVDMTINERREDCDVTAYDFPLQAYRMSGHIDFTGFFGVSGNFTGWMSADSAEVPLKANVSVIIGSIVVKLKDVKREGWIPPRSYD